MSVNKEKVFKLLSKILKKNLLAHAYLLTGPSGAEMEELALDIARLLLCQSPSTGGEGGGFVQPYCGQCQACKKTSHMTHPDLLILRPEGTMIKIAQIREMQKTLSYPPLESPRRIILILDAHKMNLDASNALLKSLEEPPTGNHFFLSSPSSSLLLSTISSRCQEIRCHEAAVGAGLKPALTSPEEIKATLHNFLMAPEIPALFEISKAMAKDQGKTLLFIQALRELVRDILLLSAGGNLPSMVREDFGVSSVERSHDRKGIILSLLKDDHDRQSVTLSLSKGDQDLYNYFLWLEAAEAMLERNINRELIVSSSLFFWIRARDKIRQRFFEPNLFSTSSA